MNGDPQPTDGLSIARLEANQWSLFHQAAVARSFDPGWADETTGSEWTYAGWAIPTGCRSTA